MLTLTDDELFLLGITASEARFYLTSQQGTTVSIHVFRERFGRGYVGCVKRES